MTIKNKIVIFLVILGIAAGIVAYWYYQKRIFSKEVLKLEILGPETVQMGEEIEYTLRYKNNGDFTLENSKLIFEYPEHSLVDGWKTRISKDLEDIYPGEEKTLQFKARILGKEGDLEVAKAQVSYRPKNLNADYVSETTLTTKIDFVPLTLEFDLPSKLESDKEIQFSLNYFSNTNYPFLDLRVQVDYPENFVFLSSNPKGIEKNEWEISRLGKAEGGRIKITGKLTGGAQSSKQFKARLGIWQEGEFVLFKETSKDVDVIKPLLYISQQINGANDYVASPGETLRYSIFFRNIGTTPFENQYLLARLDGDAFDLSTLKVNLGESRPNDNLVIWDYKQVPELRLLDVQDEGKVEFEVKLKDNWFSPQGQPNAVVKDKIDISQISQEFQTKVNSKLEIIQKGYFQDENFGNSGPIPPRVNQTTTYTIIWQAKNYYNDVKNVKVKATLPVGVELTGRIFPQDESSKFSFDSQSREIVWIINNNDVMKSGTGLVNNAPSVAFQVALMPRLDQRGRVLPIINQARIEGEDQWTGKIIQGTTPSVDTTLPDDPAVNEQQGIVVD